MHVCRDKAGNKILTGEIVIPSRWRTRSRSADEPDTGGITTRIEGTDALMWLTSDMNMYVTIVKDTMAATLPKMAVSVLLQRIIANDMLRRLQKMALGVRCVSSFFSGPSCLLNDNDTSISVLIQHLRTYIRCILSMFIITRKCLYYSS